MEDYSKDDLDDTQSDGSWRARIERAKRVNRDLRSEREENIDYRLGKPFSSDSNQNRIAVNPDWSLTKAKQATLFSQVPAVTVTSDFKHLKPAVPLFMRALNKRLAKAKVDVAMDEVLPDVINAAGIGAVMIGYQARTQTKTIPVDPAVIQGAPLDVAAPPMPAPPPDMGMAQPNMGMGAPPSPVGPPPMPMDGGAGQMVPASPIAPPMGAPMAPPPPQLTDVNYPVSKRFYANRISPDKLLTPDNFTGSDFDQADWVGHWDKMRWAEAVNEFGLTEDVKEKVCGGVSGRSNRDQERMVNDPNRDHQSQDTDLITYNELFYWRYRFDAGEKCFDCIWRIVFVDGLDDNVIHEPWRGQEALQSGVKYVGAHRFPIQVCTLTYISDESIPPSDSAIGRPQVDELIESRTHMVLQRRHSLPIRWFNTAYADTTMIDSLMRGTYQGMLPVMGDGNRAFGEIQRSALPRENFDFDRVAKSDLQDSWRLGPNQMGQFASGERSAAEAKSVQQGFQVGNGYERGRVGKFFVGIVEVMAGLMALYDDFMDVLEPEEATALLQAWNPKQMGNEFSYNIRPDSTVLIETSQRIEQLERAMNLTAKSPFVFPKPLIEEYFNLLGIDIATSVTDPEPSKPEPIAISLGLKGVEDLTNPLAIAIMKMNGQLPSPQDLQEAQKVVHILQMMGGIPVAPDLPAPIQGGPRVAPPVEDGPKKASEEQNKDWETPPRITKRVSEMNG